ncbi:sugar kinase [Solitalea koreensis]|uniref:2-dehydro-3-deoxygluconokinase n=1 Tax=Solitalea koreensis TaxID=543615 RepID=A0A521CKY9_9SPHI|nr:sugar kinase [Solitalea koreensis]SMO60094.1 2-dehydro-3-deoxygluconokinase [Solitalea koreensis]
MSNIQATLTFGELLFRISPELEQQNAGFFVGGAELNVASALGLWGQAVSYCTVLPDNILTRQVLAKLKEIGINTDAIILSGDRIGAYYLTQGADVKNQGVIYDRAHSAFSQLKPGMIDWENVLQNVDWFHWSAITPALSQNHADVCMEALAYAKSKGITTSVDLNYRSKLWNYGVEPIDVIPGLVRHCDVVMGNMWAVEKMLGISVDSTVSCENQNEDAVYLKAGEDSAIKLKQQFPNCKAVAYTYRFSMHENTLRYFSSLHADQYYSSSVYTSNKIVDRVGTGDAFMAGLIVGLKNKTLYSDTLKLATASAFSKFFVLGDCNTTPLKNIQQLVYENS